MEGTRNDGRANENPLARWKSDLLIMPYVLLRWLGTLVICAFGGTSPVIIFIVGWHMGIVHGGFVLVAFNEFPPASESYDEFYLRHLPEFKIWLSTTLIVIIGFVTSFFSKEITTTAAICYLIGLIGWFCFKYFSIRLSEREIEMAESSAS